MDDARAPVSSSRRVLSLNEVRNRLSWPKVVRLLRYSATSVVALACSEATLAIIIATKLTGATVAAAIANLVGVLPSYLLSRYWIWADADRARTGRQVATYWSISLVSMVITSFATGFIAHHSPERGAGRVAVVGLGFLGINLVLWVAKYVAYQKIVFRRAETAHLPEAGLAEESIELGQRLLSEPLLSERWQES